MINQLEEMLDELLESNVPEKSAKHNYRYLLALMKEGFHREEAIQIIVHGQGKQ